MRIDLADLTVQQAVLVSASSAAAAASWIGLAREWALELFGVPLPVVLAAAAAAFLARTFMPPASMLRTTGSFLAWTFTAALGADFVRAIAQTFIDKDLPTGATAGCAALLALVGSLLLTAEVIERARAAVMRYFDGKWSRIRGNDDANS